MNYGYYNTFLYVAKFKSISKAAKELYTSQPAVTRVIKLIEKELGCSLFVRSKYGVELTKEGEILYEYVNSGFSSPCFLVFEFANTVNVLFPISKCCTSFIL